MVKKLLAVLLLGATLGCSHPLKHTQACTMSLKLTSQCYWFVRPDGEIFEMCFDNPPPFSVGMDFRDISYKDDNADLRHFVKAQLYERRK